MSWQPLVKEARPLPLGTTTPPHIPDKSDQEPRFDPSTHLTLSSPSSVTLLDWSTVQADHVPRTKGNETSKVAFSEAFSVLSPAGVETFRAILDRNPEREINSNRTARYFRGLAYASQWIRDFNESPELLDHLSRIAGTKLVPHYMHTNYSHTNVSPQPPKPGENAKAPPVDSWHVDSVPFVLVVVVSDMTSMVGGVFQAVKRVGRDAAMALVSETNNNIPPHEMMEVSYAKRGWGIFMQGSQVLHRVSPVLEGIEPRITVVNSYAPANVFAVDRTLPSTFINGTDPDVAEREAPWEVLRGRAFRAQNQLAHIVDMPYTEDRRQIAREISLVAEELTFIAQILTGQRVAAAGYFDERSGTVFQNQVNSAKL